MGRRKAPPRPTVRRRPPTKVPANANTGMPQDAHDIRRIEARGDVTVITKDQNASGDLGVYDLKAKTITLTGNVVVSQGKNVMHGDRVVVDTETGFARVESGSQRQRDGDHAEPRPRPDFAGQGLRMAARPMS